MKSLMLLWREVAVEYGDRCYVSTARDYNTVTSRVKDEGESFLTITLPTFGKSFEQALDKGRCVPSDFHGFHCDSRGLPRFLGGFLEQIFDSSGVVLDMPNIEAVAAVRQLTLMFGKILLNCSDARREAAFAGYIRTDQQVEVFARGLADTDTKGIELVARRLWGPVLSHVDSDIENYRLVPKHGPGATADRLKGNRKYKLPIWHRRLESIFPSVDYVVPNARYSSALDAVRLVEPGAEQPSRVISVPKTLKTPRIIAAEPACMQYAQQALLRSLRDHLASDELGSWAIGIDDQDPNRDLARRGSRYRELATLDLSEASDRVSNALVKLLFPETSPFGECLQATRSRRAHVPVNGEAKLLHLHKFASMGSAMTFPIQAMVFLTIIAEVWSDMQTTPFSRARFIRDMRGKVRVYGDDIIVPVDMAIAVSDRLEAYGLKVNKSKSFWTGKFRESCGKEYYDGADVSIVRVRRVFPTKRQHAEEVVSLVSLRNQFYQTGLWATAKWLDSRLEVLLKFYPTVAGTSPVLGRESVLGYEAQASSLGLHSPLVRGWVVKSTIPSSILDGPGALLKFFLTRGDEPSDQVDHLLRAGRSLAVNIRLDWVSPF